MYALNVTDHDNITDLKITNEYWNMTLSNCTSNENNYTIFFTNNTLWPIIFMFNIPHGIYFNETIFQ